MMERLPVLTMILLAPLAGVLALCFLPRGRQDKARRIAAAVMGIGFCLTLWVYAAYDFAAGGMQFRVVKKTITTSVVKLAPNYEKHAHAPSVDIMLQSVAALFGERSIGVILTGMGHDGLDGMKAIKAVGGRTVAQDEASSVVYGMPKAVVEAGCAEKVVSLSKVIGEIMNMV